MNSLRFGTLGSPETGPFEHQNGREAPVLAENQYSGAKRRFIAGNEAIGRPSVRPETDQSNKPDLIKTGVSESARRFWPDLINGLLGGRVYKESRSVPTLLYFFRPPGRLAGWLPA